MTKKFGVSMPDAVAREIEADLEWGDSRSGRILELVRIGLAVEEQLQEHDMPAATESEKMERAREAVDCLAETDGSTELLKSA